MPEIPELEALARAWQAWLPSPEITAVAVRSPSVMKTYAPPADYLVGDFFTEVRRRGKWLFFDTRADRALAIHLMKGGRLRRTEGKPTLARADALAARFADGSTIRVAEVGSRKRSAAYFVEGDGSELVAHLGPEPLDPAFGVEELAAALGGTSRQLKPVLTDQRRIAGIGNAWSDEILHAARLAPLTPTARLEPAEIEALHSAIREVLAEGICHALKDNYLEKLAPDKRAYLRIHKRQGQPCFVCQTRLAAIHYGERVTTYCPSCQSDGRVYADRRLSRLLR